MNTESSSPIARPITERMVSITDQVVMV